MTFVPYYRKPRGKFIFLIEDNWAEGFRVPVVKTKLGTKSITGANAKRRVAAGQKVWVVTRDVPRVYKYCYTSGQNK